MKTRDEIETRLRRLIAETGAEPGGRLPSLRRMAAALGVAVSSASKAAAALRAAGVVETSGYKLFLKGARAEARRDAVPVLYPERFGGPMRRFFEGAASALKERGADAVAMPCRDAADADGLLDELLRAGAARWILWPTPEHDYAARLRRRPSRQPYAIADLLSPGHPGAAVDNRAGVDLAVEHLIGLGHRELAYVETPERAESLRERREGYVAACLAAGQMKSAEAVLRLPRWDPPPEDAWERIERERPGATALVCCYDGLAVELVRLAARTGIEVPKRWAVVGFNDNDECLATQPPVSSVRHDFGLLGRVCADLLFDPAQLARRPQLRVTPTLAVRGSSAARDVRGRQGVSKIELPGTTPQAADEATPWPADPTARVERVRTLNAQPYPLAISLAGARWQHLALSGAANARTGPGRGPGVWFGEQALEHLTAGRHVFHGVPFVVAAARAGGRGNVAVLNLPGRGRQTSRARELELEVGGTLRALYLLHAAGWVRRPGVLAELVCEYERGAPETRSLQVGRFSEREERALGHEPVLQDWFPHLPPLMGSERARPVVIAPGDDPTGGERHLYTWEWINPHARRRVRRLIIRARRGEAAYALLAATVLA